MLLDTVVAGTRVTVVGDTGVVAPGCNLVDTRSVETRVWGSWVGAGAVRKDFKRTSLLEIVSSGRPLPGKFFTTVLVASVSDSFKSNSDSLAFSTFNMSVSVTTFVMFSDDLKRLENDLSKTILLFGDDTSGLLLDVVRTGTGVVTVACSDVVGTRSVETCVWGS